MAGTNLITSQTYVQTPYISVKIGDYDVGGYGKDAKGNVMYPNYIQSLEVTKINGQVNKYSLSLTYVIKEDVDPNYFEKIFSSVSKSRAITFTYGDMSLPTFVYKKEEAIITKVSESFNFTSDCSITYNVNAVSKTNLGFSGTYTFPAWKNTKPSWVIRWLLENNNSYGLQDLFEGMRDSTLVAEKNLIPTNDLAKNIQAQTNISVLDYLQFLVNSMTPNVSSSVIKSKLYILTYCEDTTGTFGGSYFKIVQTDTAIEHPEAYVLDIGYPGGNYVFDFRVVNDENYSLFYDYQSKLHDQQYVSRLNANGDYEDVYAPVISSGNNKYFTREEDRSWWSKVTQYPIKAEVKIKGLLRPAILMSYVRINMILFGNKHISSGLYIITKQVDSVNSSGYTTTLNLVKISGDDL